MIKLIDLLKEITLLEYNKSHLDYIAAKLNVKDKNEFNSLMNALDTQGIKYHDLKKQIKDGSLKNIEDLKKLKTTSKTDKEKQIKSDAETLLDNEDFLIVKPKTYEASCKYGAGTKWCTTSKGKEGKELFTQYSNEVLIYIIDKSKPISDPLYKVAFSVESYLSSDLKYKEYSYIFWDSKDNSLAKVYKDKYLKYLISKGVNVNDVLFKYIPTKHKNI